MIPLPFGVNEIVDIAIETGVEDMCGREPVPEVLAPRGAGTKLTDHLLALDLLLLRRFLGGPD